MAPLVLALSSDAMPSHSTGGLYEVGSGYQAQTRWQRSGGFSHSVALGDQSISPEDVARNWSSVVNFGDGRANAASSTFDVANAVRAVVGDKIIGGAKPKL